MFRKRHRVTSTVGEAAGSLRAELAELGKQVERVRKRVERKQSHTLRTTMFVLAGVGVAAVAVPTLRSKLRRRDRKHVSSFSPKIVDAAIEVGVPVTAAYNQWTQFEEFPQFMEGVDEVTQIEDTLLHWAATVAGKHAEWDAQILEQEPDRRIVWESVDGKRTRGTIEFEPLAADRSRIRLHMSYTPDDPAEKAGSAIGLDNRRIKGDLKRFRELVESRAVAER